MMYPYCSGDGKNASLSIIDNDANMQEKRTSRRQVGNIKYRLGADSPFLRFQSCCLVPDTPCLEK